MSSEASPQIPAVPNWAVVIAPAARRAVEGMITAGHYDSRFGGLESESARVLAHLLRCYAQIGHAPTIDNIAKAAALPRAEVQSHLTRLRTRDLVLLDVQGETIAGAYPFIESATGHTVTFKSTGHTLATMCAIDALGAGAMCQDDVTIRSLCGMCGGEVTARTEHKGMTLGQIAPESAVVWVGLRESHGCAANTLCTELLFFCSDAHLAKWKETHGDGYRLLPEEAFQVGKSLFIDRAMIDG